MSESLLRKLDFLRKPLLAAAGLVAVAAPAVSGLPNATQTQAESQAQDAATAPLVYEVASIKVNKSGSDRHGIFFPPGGFKATNVTMHMLIRVAYGVDANQISQEPNWLKSENYDVEAKMDSSVADALRKLSEDRRKLERQRMLQALLADRFKLSPQTADGQLRRLSQWRPGLRRESGAGLDHGSRALDDATGKRLVAPPGSPSCR